MKASILLVFCLHNLATLAEKGELYNDGKQILFKNYNSSFYVFGTNRLNVCLFRILQSTVDREDLQCGGLRRFWKR